MSFLLNNAKVYEVDSNVELSEQNFFRLDRQGIDVVVLHPPLAEFNSAGRKEKGILMTDFSPNLQLAIRKAFSLANNLILLLPADTSIDSLCSSINK